VLDTVKLSNINNSQFGCLAVKEEIEESGENELAIKQLLEFFYSSAEQLACMAFQ